MGEFRMPSLGADMEAGTVLEWRVQPGQQVHRGDIVAVVDTEKSDIEVEIFEDGVVEELLIEPGVEVPVGTVLARIAAVDGAAGQATGQPQTAPESEPPALAPAVVAPAEAEEAPAAPPAEGPAPSSARPRSRGARPTGPARPRRAAPAPDRFVRASPRARRLAAERGIDLATVTGTGPDGAVQTTDLVPTAGKGAGGAAEAKEVARRPGRDERPLADRQAAMRRAIAALMARSKREIPHYYLATTIDLQRLTQWLADTNGARPVTERILPAAALLRATALAARQVPAMNGLYEDGFQPSDAVHLGVAVALRGGGLVAPAIHDADRLSVDALMAALRDLVQRARGGALRSSEMADPTITVTNLGDLGVEEVFGVIYPPQVALVGFGRVSERPWAVDGLLGVRPVVRATLAADHRVSDGHEGAKFLAAIDRLLQTPEAL